MSLLEVHDLTFGYSDEALFQGVTFRLGAGERAALVAPNGAGKSTLLRLIAGELAPDRGSVVVAKEIKLGYYRQSHELAATGTLLEALLSGFGELLELHRELAEAQERASSGSKTDLEQLALVTDRWQLLGADRLENRVQTIATRLGFAASALERPVASLSGGERGRLGLGVVLAGEPDLLLLDEPTNHLDLDTIDWLESYLVASRGAMLVVSHDRAFLDAVCPFTMELGRRTFRTYPLAYSAYHAARAEDLERERKLAEEHAAFVAKTEDFIRKNLAGQKTKQAKSRRKMLEKLERVERPEDIWATAERVRFRFAEAPRSGDIVIEAKKLAAERGEKRLFGGVELLVRRGDRVGIVGPNGCGKTTLLRLLSGNGGASDRGDVKRGTNLYDGYFDQQLGSLDIEKTGVEEIRGIRGDLSVDAARHYLARFRFWGDDPLRKVSSLSGGERTRLALAKLLLEPRNLLFLDEPTNHLDIPATEILEEALIGFEGTVLLASHDRRFLENVTTRTLSFLPQGVDVYDGGFADYMAALERQRVAREQGGLKDRPGRRRDRRSAQPAAERHPAPATATGTETGVASAAASHEARRVAQRELERKRRRVGELERAVAAAENELEGLRAKLREGAGEDWEKLHEWARNERCLSQALERLLAEWVTLSEQLAAQGSTTQETGP